jgi:HlyD family secretion protein
MRCFYTLVAAILISPVPVLPADAVSERPISALGRLLPGDEIIYLQAPLFTSETPVIRTLEVKEGDRVTKGQVVATTFHFEIAQGMVQVAEASLQEAKDRLTLTKAGVEPAELEAENSLVSSLEAECELQNNLYQRRIKLGNEKWVSPEEVDTNRLRRDVAQRQLDQARKHLEAMKHVRPEDVRIAESGVAKAEAEITRAKALAALTQLGSPINGQVLSIETWPGEMPKSDGVMAIGDVDHMRAEAEVYSGNVRLLKVGQPAEVTGDMLAKPLKGKIRAIEPMARGSILRSLNPQEPSDNWVLRVTVDLDQPELASAYSGAQVVVRFLTSE